MVGWGVLHRGDPGCSNGWSQDAERVASLVGLSDEQRAGGVADLDAVARWLDDRIAPNGASGRRFAEQHNHSFDLTFARRSRCRCCGRWTPRGGVQGGGLRRTRRGSRRRWSICTATPATRGCTTPVTGMKDLPRLPGLIAAAYQHETSRAGDPHLHPMCGAQSSAARRRHPGGDRFGSLWHEGPGGGVIYQATLRRRVWELAGLEWDAVDPHSGMAEIAGVDGSVLAAASQRSAGCISGPQHLVVVGESVTAAQLASAQKATRPKSPNTGPGRNCVREWAGRFGRWWSTRSRSQWRGRRGWPPAG